MESRSNSSLRNILLVAVAGLLPLGACTHAPGGAAPASPKKAPMTITLTEQNNGEEIHAQVADTLEVHLAENATTGYRWESDNLDTRLFELEQAAASYPSGQIGSGGDAQFSIKVRAAGTSTLRFKYWRRWEGEAGIIKRFAVKIDAS